MHLRALKAAVAASAAALCLAAAAPSDPSFVPVFKANFPTRSCSLRPTASSLTRPTTAPTCRWPHRPTSSTGRSCRSPTSRKAARRSARARKLGEARIHLGSGGASARRQISALLHRQRPPEECAMYRRCGCEPMRSGRSSKSSAGAAGVPGRVSAEASMPMPVPRRRRQALSYFKNDGNRVHARTSLWGQPLAPDGMSVTGSRSSS